MEEDRSHMTARILNLTLEVLYLLTGESLPPRKPDEHLTITVPPSHAMNPERHNMEKILEVTKKIIELLTGEMNGAGNYKSRSGKEEWEYLEGHKDLYKDVVMEDEPDGSRKRNPPQRCPRPRDSSQEDYNIVVIDELEEGVEPMDEMEPKDRNPPERCPRPLDSRTSSMSDHNLARNDQGEDPMDIKIEVKVEEEETCVMGYQGTESSEMMVSVKEEEYLRVVMEDEPDGSRKRNPPQRCPRPLEDLPIPRHDQNESLGGRNIIIKQEFIMADGEYGVMKELNEGHEDQYEDIMMETLGNRSPPAKCPRPLDSRYSTQEDLTIPNCDQSRIFGEIVVKEEQTEEDGVMEELFEGQMDFYRHMMMEPPNTRNPPKIYPHSLYSWNSTPEDLTVPHHDRGEEFVEIIDEEETCVRGDRQSAEEVEIKVTSYEKEPSLVISTAHGHDFLNTRNSCSSFLDFNSKNGTTQCSPRVDSSTRRLSVHEKLSVDNQKKVKHKKKNIFPCPECGKLFKRKSYIGIHLRTHTGKRPFLCVECGKSFLYKSSFLRHQTLHSDVRPHLCTHCGKRYKEKSALNQHLRSHASERPHPCPECSQRFSLKEHLQRHLRVHTGETPYACKLCGKCFARRDMLSLHERRHVNERPFSCLECGSCFTNPFCLVRHQKIHTKTDP